MDLAYSLFDFGTDPFIELREKIWMMVFQKAKKERLDGLVFTFSPESSVPDYFIPDLIKLIEDGKDRILFVELTCNPQELKKRIVNPSRKKYAKAMTTNVEEYYERDYLIPEEVHDRKLILDNTNLEPVNVAKKIINHFHLQKLEEK